MRINVNNINKPKIFKMLPKDIQHEVKDELKTFEEVHVEYNNGKYIACFKVI